MLLQQVSRRGIQLNMLLIGENGIGKRTFINSLCRQQYFEPETLELLGLGTTDKVELDIDTEVLDIIETDSIPIKLQISITKNFGFNVQNYSNTSMIVRFIESIYQQNLEEEQKIVRNSKFEDKRIHIGLYFIKPTGKGLNELDIECMKLVSKRINLLPIIAKIDTLTADELTLNKKLINHDIELNNIQVYNLCENHVQFETIESSKEEIDYLEYIQAQLPFGIIGSNDTNPEGQLIRQNCSGIIEIENKSICDIQLLRTVLFGSHLQELKDVTVNQKYECFRVEQLKKVKT